MLTSVMPLDSTLHIVFDTRVCLCICSTFLLFVSSFCLPHHIFLTSHHSFLPAILFNLSSHTLSVYLSVLLSTCLSVCWSFCLSVSCSLSLFLSIPISPWVSSSARHHWNSKKMYTIVLLSSSFSSDCLPF